MLAALLFMKRMSDVSEVKTLVGNLSAEEHDDVSMINLQLPSDVQYMRLLVNVLWCCKQVQGTYS